MKIAVGYVRCSTDMQDDSIDQQKQAIEKWAKDHSFKIIGWYEDEGKSGTSFEKRPAFTQLARRIESSPNFEYVLVYDESRWGRAGNPRESTYWKIHFEKHGVLVRIINSQSKNENDIGSYVVEVVEGAEASEYSKKLARSTLRGCNDNASKGFSNGGTAPYGYRRVAVNRQSGEIVRELLPGEHRRDGEEKVIWNLGDRNEIKTVRHIFHLKCSGYGYRAIADSLNKEGIACPQRGRWRNKNQMWSAGTIQSILTNPVYCGDRIYNRHPLSRKRISEQNVLGVTKERWISTEKEWIVQHGAHPSIVSRDVFTKANSSRKLAKRSNQHFHTSPYLLTGLIKCARCGFNYQGQSYRSQNIFYYVDGGHMNKGNSVCTRLSIRKEKIEGFVLDQIRENLPTSKAVSRLEEMISQFLSKRSNSDGDFKSAERALAQIQQKIENLLVSIEKGLDMETVLPRLKELEKEKKQVELEFEKLGRIAGEKIEIAKAAQAASKFISDFDKHFNRAPIQEKKALLKQIVLGVRVEPERRIATCAITKIPMVSRALTALVNPSEFLNTGHLVGAACSGGRT